MAKKEPKKQQQTKTIAVMGAPTKFKPEYVDRLLEHFDVEPYVKEQVEHSVEYSPSGQAVKATGKFKIIPNRMPTLLSFAKEIGVAYSTVWRWAERGDDPELTRRLDDHIAGKIVLPPKEISKIQGLRDFCNAYKEAKQMQKEFLINIGLSGVAPVGAYIFTAKNVTDMRDESSFTHDATDSLAAIIGMTRKHDRNQLTSDET